MTLLLSSLRKKGGRARDNYKQLAWSVPLMEEDIDQKYLRSELEQANAKLQQLESLSKLA